ncbi:hypothetical protein WT60_20515 [Burkholderia sp. MSMB617WGS]|nr:hypothetical protein WT60_20515 [Burkholderia sp. MSMB617WGS]
MSRRSPLAVRCARRTADGGRRTACDAQRAAIGVHASDAANRAGNVPAVGGCVLDGEKWRARMPLFIASCRGPNADLEHVRQPHRRLRAPSNRRIGA